MLERGNDDERWQNCRRLFGRARRVAGGHIKHSAQRSTSKTQYMCVLDGIYVGCVVHIWCSWAGAIRRHQNPTRPSMLPPCFPITTKSTNNNNNNNNHQLTLLDSVAHQWCDCGDDFFLFVVICTDGGIFNIPLYSWLLVFEEHIHSRSLYFTYRWIWVLCGYSIGWWLVCGLYQLLTKCRAHASIRWGGGWLLYIWHLYALFKAVFTL